VETYLAGNIVDARQVRNVGHVRYIAQSNVVLFRYRAIDQPNLKRFLDDWCVLRQPVWVQLGRCIL
jgi:hypothetical protein